MKFFKNPFVAVLLSLLLVFCSTVLSINAKLTGKSEDIIDGFYYGIEKNGVLNTSIYFNLSNLCDLSSEIGLIAENYGIDTKGLYSSIDSLKESYSFHSNDIEDIYECYETFYNSLFTVLVKLDETEISDRHLEFMADAVNQINDYKANIENSGYNESVKSFRNKFNRFPAKIFANILDIDYPEYFA